MLEWQYVRGQRPLSTVFFSSQCTVRQNLEQYLYFWGFGFVDLYFALMLFTYPWLTTVQNAWMETELKFVLLCFCILYLHRCVSVFCTTKKDLIVLDIFAQNILQNMEKHTKFWSSSSSCWWWWKCLKNDQQPDRWHFSHFRSQIVQICFWRFH